MVRIVQNLKEENMLDAIVITIVVLVIVILVGEILLIRTACNEVKRVFKREIFKGDEDEDN